MIVDKNTRQCCLRICQEVRLFHLRNPSLAVENPARKHKMTGDESPRKFNPGYTFDNRYL